MPKITLFLFLGFMVFHAGCSSQISGTVTDRSGETPGGIVVRLIGIDDTGAEISELAQSVTDDSGKFTLDRSVYLGASILAAAELPSGQLRGFAAGDGGALNVDALSDALVMSVIYVTETTGGRTLTDFSKDEIQALAKSSREALAENESLDWTDAETMALAVIGEVGREIADAAGGEVSGIPLEGVTGPDVDTGVPTFGASVNCGVDNFLVTADLFKFDVIENGALCNVEAAANNEMNDAFDGGAHLSVVGETFCGASPGCGDSSFPGDDDENSFAPKPPVTTEDEREIVFGPVTTDSENIEVTRKAYVSEQLDVVRYLEILENVSGSAVEVEVQTEGFMSLSESRDLLLVENGSGAFDQNSDYGAFLNTGVNQALPTVGFVFDGLGARDSFDTALFPRLPASRYTVTWAGLSLEPGETKVFAHYVHVTASQLQSDLLEVLADVHANPDMTGLSAEEINSLQNFRPSIGNILGEAGSVASFAELTVSSGGAELAVTAARDGSFKAAIDVDSGDAVQVVGSDGTDVTLTIP